jgi:hypothetical protein
VVYFLWITPLYDVLVVTFRGIKTKAAVFFVMVICGYLWICVCKLFVESHPTGWTIKTMYLYY